MPEPRVPRDPRQVRRLFVDPTFDESEKTIVAHRHFDLAQLLRVNWIGNVAVPREPPLPPDADGVWVGPQTPCPSKKEMC
jgi:hypothetical protein